ncbi:MAG: hypothetical protein E6G60_10670 [Actinobacteria bacterium]|nr:MAG: hypothetical protein E6G60_10670 [Actinomycetota bacterium]
MVDSSLPGPTDLYIVGEMSASGSAPVSSGRLADELGDALPPASSLPAEAFELVERVRELVAAVVMTDVDADQRAAADRRVAGAPAR